MEFETDIDGLVDAIVVAEPCSWFTCWNLNELTAVSLAVGALVALVIFYVGFRKTFGARRERTRVSNLALATTVLRRTVLEREVMPSSQYYALRKAKAYQFKLRPERLLNFKEALDLVLCEMLENPFLDRDDKAKSLDVITRSLSEIDLPEPTDKRRLHTYIFIVGCTALGLFSLIVGTTAYWIALQLFSGEPSEVTHIVLGLLVLFLIFAFFVLSGDHPRRPSEKEGTKSLSLQAEFIDGFNDRSS